MELQMVVRHSVGAGSEPGSCEKTTMWSQPPSHRLSSLVVSFSLLAKFIHES